MPTSAESLVFYHKISGDHYRYIAEFTEDDARKTYSEAMDVATEEFAVAHSIRLGLALNFTVFHYEVLQNQEKACKMARSTFEDAIAELDNATEDTDSALIMSSSSQPLYFTLWGQLLRVGNPCR